jgi:hypothetical protein
MQRQVSNVAKGVAMAERKSQPVDWETMLSGISHGKTVKEYSANRNLFRQGDPADSIFFLRSGKVKLTVISNQGKEAIVAIPNAGEFLGEGCLAGQPARRQIARLSGSRGRNWRACSTLSTPSPKYLSLICHAATFDMKRILSINFSTRVKSVWRGFSCCFCISARKADPNLCFPKSVRMIWQKWWALPDRGSVIS